jgi:hypothetical protein
MDDRSITSKNSQQSQLTISSKGSIKAPKTVPRKTANTIASMFKEMNGKSTKPKTKTANKQDRQKKIAQSKGTEKTTNDNASPFHQLESLGYTNTLRNRLQTTQNTRSRSPKEGGPANQS